MFVPAALFPLSARTDLLQSEGGQRCPDIAIVLLEQLCVEQSTGHDAGCGIGDRFAAEQARILRLQSLEGP
jgi:hypothetical protein